MNKSLKNVLIAGTASGIISGLVKLGWENIMPPRTPERDEVNPPQTFLQQLGIPAEITQSTYRYSGHRMPWASFLRIFSNFCNNICISIGKENELVN